MYPVGLGANLVRTIVMCRAEFEAVLADASNAVSGTNYTAEAGVQSTKSKFGQSLVSTCLVGADLAHVVLASRHFCSQCESSLTIRN